MPGTTLPSEMASRLAGPSGLFARVERLERVVKPPDPTPATTDSGSVSFSYPGTVQAGVASPRWYANRAISYGTVRISTNTAGSGNCTVAVSVNGSTVVTVTVGSGANTAVYSAAFSVAMGDYIDVATTAVAGQADVSVQLVEA